MKEVKSLGAQEAKELVKNGISEISPLMDMIAELQADIRDIKKEIKNEGINISAFNLALRRTRKLSEGKNDLESTIEESDIYLESLKV